MLLRVVHRSNILRNRCSGFALSRSCSGFALLLVVAAARGALVAPLHPVARQASVKPLAQAVRLAVGVQRVQVEQIAAQVVQIAAPVLIASRCAPVQANKRRAAGGFPV